MLSLPAIHDRNRFVVVKKRLCFKSHLSACVVELNPVVVELRAIVSGEGAITVGGDNLISGLFYLLPELGASLLNRDIRRWRLFQRFSPDMIRQVLYRVLYVLMPVVV